MLPVKRFLQRTGKTPSLAHRIRELKGLYVRLHVNAGRTVSAVDGVCQGIEGDVVVLSPSSQGQRAEISLGQIGAVNQLAWGSQR